MVDEAHILSLMKKGVVFQESVYSQKEFNQKYENDSVFRTLVDDSVVMLRTGVYKRKMCDVSCLHIPFMYKSLMSMDYYSFLVKRKKEIPKEVPSVKKEEKVEETVGSYMADLQENKVDVPIMQRDEKNPYEFGKVINYQYHDYSRLAAHMSQNMYGKSVYIPGDGIGLGSLAFSRYYKYYSTEPSNIADRAIKIGLISDKKPIELYTGAPIVVLLNLSTAIDMRDWITRFNKLKKKIVVLDENRLFDGCELLTPVEGSNYKVWSNVALPAFFTSPIMPVENIIAKLDNLRPLDSKSCALLMLCGKVPRDGGFQSPYPMEKSDKMTKTISIGPEGDFSVMERSWMDSQYVHRYGWRQINNTIIRIQNYTAKYVSEDYCTEYEFIPIESAGTRQGLEISEDLIMIHSKVPDAIFQAEIDGSQVEVKWVMSLNAGTHIFIRANAELKVELPDVMKRNILKCSNLIPQREYIQINRKAEIKQMREQQKLKREQQLKEGLDPQVEKINEKIKKARELLPSHEINTEISTKKVVRVKKLNVGIDRQNYHLSCKHKVPVRSHAVIDEFREERKEILSMVDEEREEDEFREEREYDPDWNEW